MQMLERLSFSGSLEVIFGIVSTYIPHNYIIDYFINVFFLLI